MAGRNIRRVAYVGAAVTIATAATAPVGLAFSAGRAARASSLVTARSASAPRGPVRILGGLTSQGWPVVATVSKDGRRIGVIRLGLMMNCGKDGSFAVMGGDNQLRIPRNGKIAMAGSWQQTSGTLAIIGEDSFAGRINQARTSLAGTWHLRLLITDSSNGQTSECDSGSVSFDAIH